MTKKPNILFLMTDEHRADVTGYEGNSIIKTPVLDKLASNGLVFSNAYTPSPICVPARQCLMAGQLPKRCGCEGWVDLKPGYMTFSRLLSMYAYETVACGKLHHGGTDQMQGWTQRIGNEMKVAPTYIKDKKPEEFQKYLRPFNDYKWSDTKEVKRAGIGKSRCQTVDEYTMLGALGFIDEYLNDAYYDRERKDQPLLLKVSLLEPHYPYCTDESKFKYYLNRVKPYFDESLFDHPFLSLHQVIPEKDASKREITRAVAAYYGMIEQTDEYFGQILDALKNAGQDLDDWIIIYTSDHGEMLGQHNVWEKQKFFEASARVPLIISYPKKFSHNIVDKNVNLCDLFATICDLADIPTPDDLDSRSLVPLMAGENDNWDNESISYFIEGDIYNLMIKKDHLKYQYYKEDLSEVLFDLIKDPSETINYIDDSSYKDKIDYFKKRREELL